MSERNRKFVLLLTAFLFVFGSVQAKETIRSSVSPEFLNGLHAKYLRYIADKMSMELVIYPMPFARRVQALKKAEIDIMVGLKGTQTDNEGYHKLTPAYERLQSLYFVKSENIDRLKNSVDLKQLVVGLTIDEKLMLDSVEMYYREMVPVSTLNQKIELLLLDRIDSFVHFGQSAQYVIETRGLESKIVPATFQNSSINDYHVTISTQSPLYVYREKLETVVRQGLKSKDFIRIRQQHYEELQAKKEKKAALTD